MQATLSPPVSPYPVRVEGHLEHPSRGLWLIKWLLLIPRYFVLAFLCIALFLGSVMAFVALAGPQRWVLRVVTYATVMTSEYPPFRVDHGDEDPGGVLTAMTAPPTDHQS